MGPIWFHLRPTIIARGFNPPVGSGSERKGGGWGAATLVYPGEISVSSSEFWDEMDWELETVYPKPRQEWWNNFKGGVHLQVVD